MKPIKLFLLSLFLLFISGCSTGTYEIDNPIPVNISNPVDPQSGGLLTIATEHERVHAGEGFQFSKRLLNLASGSISYFLMNTTTDGIHWGDFTITCDDVPILVELYEDPVVTSYGTLEISSNRNRFSSHNSSASIYSNATISNDGTLLETDEIIGQKHSAGSTGAIPLEWILKTNETYVIKITNNNGNGVNCISKAFWYELEHD